MEGEARFVGIDVSKAQVDVAVRPTGKTWTRPYDQMSRAAAKHTTVAERKCTTGVMPEGADLGVGVATGTVVGGRWED